MLAASGCTARAWKMVALPSSSTTPMAVMCGRASSFRARRAKMMNTQKTSKTRKHEKLQQELAQKVAQETGRIGEVRGQSQKSLGMLVEDYIPDAATSPGSLLSVNGLKERYQMIRRWGTSVWSKYIILPSQLTGFSRDRTALECQDIYRIINEAIPKNDKHAITENTTNLMNQMLRSQFEPTFAAGNRIQWEMKSVLEAPKIHHARAFAMTTQKNYWAQLTMKLVTEQVVCIYDRKGKVVFGHPKDTKRVVEYPCFERHVSDPASKWRLCGKLAIDDPRRANGLVPLDPVVQAAMDGKSPSEQALILKEQGRKMKEEMNADTAKP